MKLSWWGGAILMALMTMACSSEESGSGTGGSTASTGNTGGAGGGENAGGAGAMGGGDAGGMGGMGGMGGCVLHDQEADAVEAVFVDENVPAPTGGPIAEGLYYLVEQRRYTGPGGMTGPAGAMWQETAVWTKTEVQTVVDAFDGSGERRLGLAFDLGGGSGDLSISVVCPEPLSLPWTGYTADETTLVLYSTNPPASWHYAHQTHP